MTILDAMKISSRTASVHPFLTLKCKYGHGREIEKEKQEILNVFNSGRNIVIVYNY